MASNRLVTLIPLCLSLAACLDATVPSSVQVVDPKTIQPDSHLDLLAAMASSLACDPAGLTWSIQEQTANPGAWNASVDGSVTQSGLLSAPRCGSAWVGLVIHIQALCVANGNMGVAAITTAQEVLNAVSVSVAMVRQCGEAACLSTTPTDINVRLCLASEPQTTVQYFSMLDFTCGPIYSPPLLPEYSTLPACSF